MTGLAALWPVRSGVLAVRVVAQVTGQPGRLVVRDQDGDAWVVDVEDLVVLDDELAGS